MNSEKVRVSREEQFLKNKKIDDILYISLLLKTNYNPRTGNAKILKSKIKITELAGELKVTRQTVSTRLKHLIASGYLKEDDNYYIFKDPEYYYDIETKTARLIKDTLSQNSIKLYVYLLGWYEFYNKKGGEFHFSFDTLADVIGLHKGSNARTTISNILYVLGLLDLVHYSEERDKAIIINGMTTYHYRLLKVNKQAKEK